MGLFKKMTNSLNTVKECYSEADAAAYLNISVERLHSLLDQNVFNDGTPRPANLTFSEPDLLVLGFWMKTHHNPKVIRMPRR